MFMKENKRRCLTLEIRQVIWMMKGEGLGIREIARRTWRDASVISREFKRNSIPGFISARVTALDRAKEAHEKAKRRLKEKRRGKRKARPLMQVHEHIANKLSGGFSPEIISKTLGEKFPDLRLSTSTIYRMIKQDAPELIKYLPERGKKRRLRVMDRRSRFQQAATTKRHKDERPIEANNRSEIGHLEGDAILSKRGSKAAVLSLCDRKARKRWYRKLPNLEAQTVRKTLVPFLHSLPSYARKTLTLDRGSEFAEWDMLEKIFPDLRVYFCTPYAPHEKGSVERSNRDLRRYYPKGTNFSLVQNEELKQVETRLNNRPMKCLHWKSPDEFYREELEHVNQELCQKAA